MLKYTMAALTAAFALTSFAGAEDAEGCADHPAVSRYPGTELQWCTVENYMEYRVPLGPVTGYRTIGEWEDTEGRVTRNYYAYNGTDRTHAEVYANFKEALEEGGFDILATGVFPASQVSREIGGKGWQGVVFAENAWSANGAPVNALLAGTSTSGGSGAVVAKKVRADDIIYVVFNVEQHSEDVVAMLIDVVETKPAETGLVVANAEAMGKDIEEKGRTVIEGLMFDHDKATLKAESKPALDEAAKLLEAMADKSFYVVGHTDSTGTFAYNMKLSADRAAAVREALVEQYGISPDRLQSAGVGPLSPVFTNASDGGREKNRRVELVEQ
ncbi:MAG: OmpA family protein [Pseudomonadota bacterium]